MKFIKLDSFAFYTSLPLLQDDSIQEEWVPYIGSLPKLLQIVLSFISVFWMLFCINMVTLLGSLPSLFSVFFSILLFPNSPPFFLLLLVFTFSIYLSTAKGNLPLSLFLSLLPISLTDWLASFCLFSGLEDSLLSCDPLSLLYSLDGKGSSLSLWGVGGADTRVLPSTLFGDKELHLFCGLLTPPEYWGPVAGVL